MFTFDVQISKWLQGEESQYSFLLRPSDNKMCCLGFMAKALGYEENDLREIVDPHELTIKTEVDHFPSWFFDYFDYKPSGCSNALVNIMRINDDPQTTLQDKIKGLKEKFLQHNINVNFIP